MKPSQQQGLTLIELMVALLISLLIMAGLFTVYQSNQRGYRLNDGLVRVQESGRFAVDFLTRDIRQAAFPASDAGVQGDLFTGSANDVPVVGNPNTSDTLNLRHGTLGDETTDCNGQSPTINGGGGNADAINGLPNTTLNQYDVRATGRTNNRGLAIFALFCNNIEIVEGIENMQVLYGVDTGSDAIADRYYTVNMVPGSDWSKVVSLRIALLASSVDERKNTASTRTFSLLDTNLPAFGDQKIRRVYTTTVLIRNNTAL